MNFIGRKFSPAKSPPRRSISLNSLKRNDRNQSDISAEFNKIRINFGDQKAKFKDGEWITGKTGYRSCALKAHRSQITSSIYEYKPL
ncbi:Protein chibby-like protein 1 [Armadillidium nasatum]|uniref:Protein chibby-like protein 1 n=1 Tax=Armadillidium nasatum TaxID=96803 RepID=A0A5N5TNG2_9CRUS|nr:Protein chibby-like protein 1 [Armadillidium nasatum]